MITEDYVSFETAKLLKEKGFDGGCTHLYNLKKQIESGTWPQTIKHDGVYMDKNGYILCPTLQMAMKWLREVHNIHIAVIVTYHYFPRRYEAHIMKLKNIDDFILHQQVDFVSYEEACEAAIRYCLENLI